jgi:hypothetical protein
MKTKKESSLDNSKNCKKTIAKAISKEVEGNLESTFVHKVLVENQSSLRKK